MKIFITVIIILSMFVTLTSCAEKPATSPFMEDLEYLAYVLENNFSLYDVAYWAHGADIPASIESVRNDILSNPDMDVDEFFLSLWQNIDPLIGVGHFSIVTPYFHQSFQKSSSSGHINYNHKAVDRLLLPHVVDFYMPRYDMEFEVTEEGIRSQVNDLIDRFLILNEKELASELTMALENGNTSELIDFYEQAYNIISDNPNINTRIIEEGRIAYLSIASFMNPPNAAERRQLFGFYSDIRDYEHLIIDLRLNGGGRADYFPLYIIGPMISSDFDINAFAFFTHGEYSTESFPPEHIQELVTINRTHVFADTYRNSQMLPVADIIEGHVFCEKICEITGKYLFCDCYPEGVVNPDELKGVSKNLMPLGLYMRPTWLDK